MSFLPEENPKMRSKKLAFAFKSISECQAAKDEIDTKYHDLKTTMVDSNRLTDGYCVILFVEDKHSLNFNLYLKSIIISHGGKDRDDVRI